MMRSDVELETALKMIGRRDRLRVRTRVYVHQGEDKVHGGMWYQGEDKGGIRIAAYEFKS